MDIAIVPNIEAKRLRFQVFLGILLPCGGLPYYLRPVGWGWARREGRNA
jgi:hypothetical protein